MSLERFHKLWGLAMWENKAGTENCGKRRVVSGTMMAPCEEKDLGKGK